MNYTNAIRLVLIVLIAAIYIDLRLSGALRFSQSVSSSDTVVVHLPPQVFNLPPSAPVTVINQPLPERIDTMQIVQAYFSTKTYKDSVVTDTIAITLTETVSENSIQSREVSYRLKVPLTTTIVQHHKDRIMLGGLAQFNAVSPAVGYLTRRQQMYFVAYDPWNETVRLGGFVPVGR